MKIILPRFRIKYSDAIEGILVEFRAYIFVKDINGQDEKLCGCCLFSYIYMQLKQMYILKLWVMFPTKSLL